MIKIVRARTLAGLRKEAAQLPRLRRQIAESRRAVEVAAAEAARFAAEFDVAVTEAGGRLGRLLAAVREPAAGASIQAGIALYVVRDMIAEAKASGDAAVIEGIRVIDALLGENLPLVSFPATARSELCEGAAAGRGHLSSDDQEVTHR